MVQAILPEGIANRRRAAPAACAALVWGAALGGLWFAAPAPRTFPIAHPATVAAQRDRAAPVPEAAPTDPAPTRLADVPESQRDAPMGATQPPAEPAEAGGATPFALGDGLQQEVQQEPPRVARSVPLPVPRPPEFRRPGDAAQRRRPEREAAQRLGPAPAPMEETRSFFETLFGTGPSPSSPPALAYAAPERGAIDPLARRPLAPDATGPGLGPGLGPMGIAVYDIAARIVTLPSGERLEAHSGLGETMDDPGNVHLPMRGATPPGTYDLTERERPFHGVRAIRLNPVGGSAAVHGRVGLLAHTYMLGPSGASNGCVSVKDYDRFLQAYLRGEIQRLVVVPGRGDAVPAVAGADAARAVRVSSAL